MLQLARWIQRYLQCTLWAFAPRSRAISTPVPFHSGVPAFWQSSLARRSGWPLLGCWTGSSRTPIQLGGWRGWVTVLG